MQCSVMHVVVSIEHGRSQEFSFTEARLNETNAGGLEGRAVRS